ncbi:thioesterase family protein [Rhodococcus sp. ARC_M6]|uniref:thioesterase family protein n=1 Tax=Rhodococcus sp. ARC_M6 TaxID=2928852 RepID=UPI001FB4EF83|nr:thioesterase family protein [Rhodococcus sp. ARC_M6]MCJ0905656.1 thioesterase family protein [Rhodococcus sp. ARC_M6]
MIDSSYYRFLGTTEEGYERFASTPATVSLWGPTLQHGAPPSALLVRALERCGAREGTRLTRVVVEILGPIPIADIEVRSWIERPGRRIELIVAELWATAPDGSSRAVARGTAWRMETADTTEVVHVVDPALEPREGGKSVDLSGMWKGGYLDTLDWSWITEIGCEGAGKVWAKPKPALVDGEELTALERLFVIADISNGVGAKLNPEHWTFLNTDLTVHIFRVPEGEWIGVSAETTTGPDGVGMCAGVLYDEQGAVGRIAQTLQIRARS